MNHKSQPLIEYFMETMVEPVVQALRKQDTCSKGAETSLKTKIEELGGELISEINRIQQNNDAVALTIDFLLDQVDKIVSVQQNNGETDDDDDKEETPAPFPVSSPLTSENSDTCTDGGLSITEMVLLNTLCMKSHEQDLDSPIVPSSPISSSDDSSSLKEMPTRKRAKRSLEDTVQMLSKENSVSPPATPRAPVQPSLPFVLPQMSVPFSNAAMMQRWLGSPFANPMYLNAMNAFQQPLKPSEEQLTVLMKMSMHAANIIKNTSPPQLSFSGTDSDVEDIKIDVESDDGELGVSPSPSADDLTENESSSSSSGPLTSPTSGDVDSILEKPFICMHNNCGKRFANKFLLKKHMFIHTGLRPHTCPHCHKKFNRKDNLLRHKKTHNPNESLVASLPVPKAPLYTLTQLPALHNLALTQGFNHFHALKMSLENGASAVRSPS